MPKKSITSIESFVLHPRRGQWSLQGPGGRQAATIRHADCRLQVNGQYVTPSAADQIRVIPHGWRKDPFRQRGGCYRIDLECRFDKYKFLWTIRFDIPRGRHEVRLQAVIRNLGNAPLRLGDCDLWVLERAAGGVLRLGPHPGEQRIFAFNGGLGTQQVRRITADRGRHQGAYLQHIFNPASRQVLLAGFLTFDRMHTRFECRYDASGGAADGTGRCCFHDYELPAGAAIASEILRVALEQDPHDALTSWADQVAAHYRPRIWNRPPPVGWVGWAWVDKRVEIPERQVAVALDAIRTRLHGFGVDYLWVSIANLKDGLPGNWLEDNRENFPRGFRATLARIRRAGMKPGLWAGLFYINENARAAFAENRGNLLLEKKTGKPRPVKRWAWAYKARDGAEPLNYALDASHPRSLAYLRRVFAAYRKWGIRYFMFDFLNAGSPSLKTAYHDRRMVCGPAIPRRGLLAARRTAGAATHILTASGSQLHHIGCMDTMRIGSDYGEGRQLQPRFASFPGTYAVNGTMGSSGSPQGNCLQNTAAYFFAHRRFFLNSQNNLTVDRPIPRNEAEFSASLFGMTGSPMKFGDALDRISEDRLALIKKVLPRPRDWPFPADLFERVYPEDYARVLVAPVRAEWGPWTVVAVFNLDDVTATTEVSMRALRLPETRRFLVWDFWQERYCGQVRGRFRVDVPPRSCRVLRLATPASHPMVLSTDMHVRQGQFELEKVRWDPRRHTLSGKARRPRGERGSLYLHVPPGWKPADYTGLFVAKDAHDGILVLRKPLLFARTTVPWSVAFVPLDGTEKRWQRRHHARIGRGRVPPCRDVL